MKNTKLWPFTDEAFDQVIAATHQATLKTLRDGTVLVKVAAGYTVITRKTSEGWRVDFASTTHDQIDNATALAWFLDQVRQEVALCKDITAKVKNGAYGSLLEAGREFDRPL